MTKKEYNGWFNYETWLVKLWIDNDQGSQSYWQEQAAFLLTNSGQSAHRSRFTSDLTKEEIAALALSEQIKEQHEEALPELEGFAADLINAAMSEVNWHEIAESLINDAKEAVEV